ncbi:phosphoribosylamine/glycine ligase [Thermodesulfatator indicus DSM 15286]|uniref:Multifunctional fusion protein n=1 Tax=Thermodesulfatator indicus (strain DSM 15286 / JCM 11887 / CIR29812) TaxID=667014 RepID=F8A8J6_THEID|nr:phosphoribosylamine--glycine ligase [Thermodesulfatator indicus]AEH45082.1 phosphoribosylamine/glycine ligase [Thermodesulfatator indicus DSM 15286]
MKVLVLGSGGREHALCWKLAQSPLVTKVYCAPGNAGIAEEAECVPISVNDFQALADFAQKENIDFTIVGPEDPLAKGIVDFFEKKGLKIFGPSAKAAQIEGSKVFAKEIMAKYGIPTASFEVFDDPQEALAYVEKKGAPIVVKADGLAAGKGVIVCSTLEDAREAIHKIMVEKAFGEAGNRVVIEECLFGEEASFMILTDGKTLLVLPSSQDHKPLLDGDKGPNTGGMGAYSPAPVVTPELEEKIMKTIMEPLIKGLAEEGIPYKGVLYAGLMIVEGNPYVLEFNCRFGDPECQPLMMRIKSDLAEIIMAALEGNLAEKKLELREEAAVCVVMASKGYPGKYEKGKVIKGLEEAAKIPGVKVFHAGTAKKGGQFVTNGGRVLGVTALGKDIPYAIDKAYEAVEKISWEGVHFRRDIGRKAIKHLPPKVLVFAGSKSDLPVILKTEEIFQEFLVPYRIVVASSYRNPEKVRSLVKTAETKGVKVFIAGAGLAAHLAGAIASETILPVIGLPLATGTLGGIDALLATAQMPPGVPVATVTINGSVNAAILAIKILALSDERLQKRLTKYKEQLAQD